MSKPDYNTCHRESGLGSKYSSQTGSIPDQRAHHGTWQSGDKRRIQVRGLHPLAEQNRIVAKVDELMQLCDQLEQQADHSHQLSAKLMDSVIYHLFEPAAAL